MAVDYETDFYAWADEQATLLLNGDRSAADVAHIAEEIESMARREKHEFADRLTVLLIDLLNWQFQPGFRSSRWSSSVREQRIRLDSHLGDNPSLKAKHEESYLKAYKLAVIAAARGTGLPESSFPAAAPYTFKQATDDGFWPA